MENEGCSIRTSKMLSRLGMVSMEAVFDNEGFYEGTSMFSSMNSALGGNLWFKIQYSDALIWLSEHLNCNIWIYQEYPELSDLWKARILPGGPVFVGGFAIPVENTWAVVAEVAISTVCSVLLDLKENKDGVKYFTI